MDTLGSSSVAIEPKEVVKVFGRLAEKYIMLDSSGGMCCYSACSDCEFRLPDGGYRMADQSASRPKWIPCYESREFESMGKSHTSKWRTDIFASGPSITKEDFVTRVLELKFAPPLGGPYLSASSANIEDTSVVETLFDLLVDGEKSVLTRHKMSIRMKELAGGEEGWTWKEFEKAITSYAAGSSSS